MVFYSNDSGKGKKSKRNVECYNCHRKGHYKADCWKEGGGKAGQGPKGKSREKPKEAAASASVLYCPPQSLGRVCQTLPDSARVCQSLPRPRLMISIVIIRV